jgi:outer membrane protein assembly factor BamB
MRKIATLSLILALTSSITIACFPVSSSSFGDNWTMFRYDSAHTGTTTSIGPKQVVKLWTYEEGHFDGSFIGSSAAIVEGVVYVGANEQSYATECGNIYAFDANTGTKIWNYSTNRAIYSSPAVSGGVLFIGIDDSVCAFNASTGLRIWNYPTGGVVISSPNVVNGAVYVGSSDSNVYALNASTGNIIWNFTSTGPSEPAAENGITGAFASSPAVANEVVYIGSSDGNVYALSAATGAKIWNYTTSKQPLYSFGNQIYSSPTVSDGIVYVGSVGGNIYALNASTGAKIWNYCTNPDRLYGGGYYHGVTASPAIANGIVYVGSVDGNIYALNLSSGKQIWAEKFFRILSSVSVSDDVIYVGIANNVTALNATTGSQIWVFPTQNQINSSPTISEGVIYIGSQDGNFYALGERMNVPSPNPMLIVAFMIVIALVAVGLLVYFKKRNH